MAKLLQNLEINQRFEELLAESSMIEVAVAWATLCPQMKKILNAAQKQKLKAKVLIGLGGYITDPMHLEAIAEHADLRIYGKPVGQLFHPKFYRFRTPSDSISWIGSANLTYRGFHGNIELIAEFSDNDIASESQFENLWACADSVPFKSFDIEKYRSERNSVLAAIPRKIKEALNLPHQPIATSQILGEEWPAYYEELQSVRPDAGKGFDLTNWLDVLDQRTLFTERDWKEDFTEDDVKMMFGINPFAPFGRLNAMNKAKFVGPAGTKRKNDIGTALTSIKNMKRFEQPLIEKFFTNLINVDGVGPALATRMLTLTRPDWFVVVNKRSVEGLAKRFQVPDQRNIQPKHYVELLGKLQSQPWWKSPAPEDPEELYLWNYRAALIDPLVYNGADFAVMGKNQVEFDD